MTTTAFAQFCNALIGTWIGERQGTELSHEKVKAVWERTLGNAFLQEHWSTSGRESTLGLQAVAYFKIGNDSPAEFIVAYRSGKVACGHSSFQDDEWALTHKWFPAGETAEIRLKFLNSDTYRQEVVEINEKGAPRLLSKAILTRERGTTIQPASEE